MPVADAAVVKLPPPPLPGKFLLLPPEPGCSTAGAISPAGRGGAIHCFDLIYPQEQSHAWDELVTRISPLAAAARRLARPRGLGGRRPLPGKFPVNCHFCAITACSSRVGRCRCPSKSRSRLFKSLPPRWEFQPPLPAAIPPTRLIS